MDTDHTVAVYGAYGHTGRFVVSELRARGLVPVLSGRDPAKLAALASGLPGIAVRPASVDDPASLDAALAGAAAVVNCAGPFATTAAPVIEAALRAGIPYVDTAAEVEAVADTFARFAAPARAAGVAVVPAMAFYGGLGDLLVTAAAADWPAADEVHLAYALSSWHPTAGTRATSKVSRGRRGNRRIVHAGGGLAYRTGDAPTTDWPFPAPVGTRRVLGEFTLADSVTIPRHLEVPDMHTYMTLDAVRDVVGPDTPPPTAVDDRGRSAQTFLVDVAVRAAGETRHAVARGQDIYAVSAPLAVEAVERVLSGRTRVTGVAAAGEIFDARDFLGALGDHLAVEVGARTTG
jgi:hypothetical protein